MKKIVIVLVCIISSMNLRAGVLDSIAAYTQESDTWDQETIKTILERNNALLATQIDFLTGAQNFDIDLENPSHVTGRKSYEREVSEIAHEIILEEVGTSIKASQQATKTLVNAMEKQKDLNEKFIDKLDMIEETPGLKEKTLKRFQKIARINATIAKSIQQGRTFSRFARFLRKGQRGTIKAKILLSLGFNKTEVKNMLIFSEPALDQKPAEHEQSAEEMIRAPEPVGEVRVEL